MSNEDRLLLPTPVLSFDHASMMPRMEAQAIDEEACPEIPSRFARIIEKAWTVRPRRLHYRLLCPRCEEPFSTDNPGCHETELGPPVSQLVGRLAREWDSVLNHRDPHLSTENIPRGLLLFYLPRLLMSSLVDMRPRSDRESLPRECREFINTVEIATAIVLTRYWKLRDSKGKLLMTEAKNQAQAAGWTLYELKIELIKMGLRRAMVDRSRMQRVRIGQQPVREGTGEPASVLPVEDLELVAFVRWLKLRTIGIAEKCLDAQGEYNEPGLVSIDASVVASPPPDFVDEHQGNDHGLLMDLATPQQQQLFRARLDTESWAEAARVIGIPEEQAHVQLTKFRNAHEEKFFPSPRSR